VNHSDDVRRAIEAPNRAVRGAPCNLCFGTLGRLRAISEELPRADVYRSNDRAIRSQHSHASASPLAGDPTGFPVEGLEIDPEAGR